MKQYPRTTKAPLMSTKHPHKTPEICPVCSEAVPPGSLACPECGADHRSGWKESSSVSADLGLPDEDFDYVEFVKNEFGTGVVARGIKPIWWITAMVLLAVIL